MMYCQDCGAELSPGAQYCSDCGAAVGSPVDSGQQQSESSGSIRGNQRAINTDPGRGSQSSSGSITRRALVVGGGVVTLGAGWFVFSEQRGSEMSSGSPPLDQLVIQFLDVRQPDVGATSATLPLILTFYNPTNTTVPDISGDFDLLINDQRVASEELTVNQVEPDEETVVNADVIIQYADSGAAAVDAVQSGRFSVELAMILNAGGATRELRLTEEV